MAKTRCKTLTRRRALQEVVSLLYLDWYNKIPYRKWIVPAQMDSHERVVM